MANKVNSSPSLPNIILLGSIQDVSSYLTSLVLSLTTEISAHAQRLNNVLIADGSEQAAAPIMVNEYPKASLPSAVKYKGGNIMVTDDVGGYTPAFSDGTNWRRTADRNVIS